MTQELKAGIRDGEGWWEGAQERGGVCVPMADACSAQLSSSQLSHVSSAQLSSVM